MVHRFVGARVEGACLSTVARVSSTKKTSSCSSRIYHNSSVSFGMVSPFVLREALRRLGGDNNGASTLRTPSAKTEISAPSRTHPSL